MRIKVFRHGGDRKAVDAKERMESCDGGRERTSNWRSEYEGICMRCRVEFSQQHPKSD